MAYCTDETLSSCMTSDCGVTLSPLDSARADSAALFSAGGPPLDSTSKYALGTAEGTVKNQASSIMSKLGVRDRTRAVLKALEKGWLVGGVKKPS